MANFENIKPYADFAHKTAQHGGIEKYLSMIAEANRRLGILEERSTEGRKAALVVGAAILIWEGSLQNPREDALFIPHFLGHRRQFS